MLHKNARSTPPHSFGALVGESGPKPDRHQLTSARRVARLSLPAPLFSLALLVALFVPVSSASALTRLLQLSTSQLNYGAVPLNSTSTLTVTLTSVGTNNVRISSTRINGSEFKVVGGTVPVTLRPSQSVTLQVQFTALSAGSSTALLIVGNNSTGGTRANVSLSGNGAASSSSQLSPSTTALNFGSVALNSPKTQALTLTASGASAVTISSEAVTGSGFVLLGSVFPVTLNPNQTVTLQLQFDPTSQGQKTGQLTIASNATNQSSIVVALNGSGQAGTHTVSLTWSPPSTSPDPVTGYNVYRSVSGQTFQKLNAQPQSQSSFVDSAVASGTTYTYEVKSVDAQAVESTASNSTDVSVP